MADAREPYLVQVNAIDVRNDGEKVVTKAWLNIYYISRLCEVQSNMRHYEAGARWCAVLVNGAAVYVDDDDCEKIITNINGSY